jgi:hypothetical protein
MAPTAERQATTKAPKAPKEKKLTGTCAQCGRDGLRILHNGTLPSHKARGQYGRCAGFMPVEGSVVLR